MHTEHARQICDILQEPFRTMRVTLLVFERLHLSVIIGRCLETGGVPAKKNYRLLSRRVYSL